MFLRVGYENRRDGIDDYRYLQMLEDAVAAKPDHTAAAEASEFLEALRIRVLETAPHKAKPDEPLAIAEYDAIRGQIADWITKIGPVPSRHYYP